MKTRLLIALLLMVTTMNVSAKGGLIEFGLKAGITTQNVDFIRGDAGIQSIMASSRAGFQIGAMSRINLGLLHIQPELLYSYSGYKLMASGNNMEAGPALPTSKSKVRMNSVDLPILVGIKFLFLRINAGPVFNLMNSTSVVNSDKINHDVEIVKPTIGFAAGIGANLGKINIDLRYNGNFKKPIQSIKIGDLKSFDYKSKFNSWALSVGYMF